MFENLSLNEACKEQHAMAMEKGFEPQPVPINLMLIVSELGEACEADRKNRHADLRKFQYYYEHLFQTGESLGSRFKNAFEHEVKDTFEDEIADAFMRLMDLYGAMNIDIEKHIRMKAEYNLLRPTKHGKSY